MRASVSQPFPIVIDKTQSLPSMIERVRCTAGVEDVIAERFSIAGGGISERAAFVVSFDSMVRTETIKAELERLGLRPGDLAELLAFGAQRTEVKGWFSIVELASTIEDPGPIHWAAGLCVDERERALFTRALESRWEPWYRFLAFQP